MVEISVVIPVYNERKRVTPLAESQSKPIYTIREIVEPDASVG